MHVCKWYHDIIQYIYWFTCLLLMNLTSDERWWTMNATWNTTYILLYRERADFLSEERRADFHLLGGGKADFHLSSPEGWFFTPFTPAPLSKRGGIEISESKKRGGIRFFVFFCGKALFCLYCYWNFSILFICYIEKWM